MILDILGDRLIENQNYLDTEKTHALLKTLLKNKPVLGGFGLFDTQGNAIAMSENIDPKKMPNLLKNINTRETFLETLNAHRMVIGNAYFFGPLQDWVTPLRKAIRNPNGEVVSVLTTGLRHGESGYLSSVKMPKNFYISIVRDQNKFPIYLTGLSESERPEVYQNAINASGLKGIRDYLQKHYQMTFDDVKRLGHPIVYANYSEILNSDTYQSANYLSDYNLWVVIIAKQQPLIRAWLIQTVQNFVVFLILAFLLFWLFRINEQHDSKIRTQLVHQANHDALTQLPNRLYLKTQLPLDLKRFEHYRLFYIDLDNFKKINDHFGHEIADHLLLMVTKRLKGLAKPNDKIIRFEGDEFILISSVANQDEIQLCQTIIKELRKPFYIENTRFNLGSSIGVAKYPEDAQEFSQILSYADMAMLQAKKHKNSFALFSKDLQVANQHRNTLEHYLRSALERHELYLVYQPQLSFGGKLHGVEALLRWDLPKLGHISPAEFIPIAEETGLMPNIGSFVTSTALKEIGEIQSELKIPFILSINVSVKQFMEVGFKDNFLKCITNSHLQNTQITVEVTESLFIEEIDYIIPLLNDLRKTGIKISMDDFGTGYSSLNLLRKLPVDELKIDKSFTDDILIDEQDAKLIENIIDIARNLEIDTLAEGVETLEQAEKLHTLGCQLYQGFYSAKPLTVSQLRHYIAKTVQTF